MKRILLMIIALWLSVMGVAQTEEVIVGSNDTIVYYAPHYSGGGQGIHRSLSAQILTPNDLGAPGLITSLSFLKLNATDDVFVRDVQICIKYTDLQQFDDNGGFNHTWEPVTAEDLVYSGNYVISKEANQWITVTFDQPFYYDGLSNLYLLFFDKTESYIDPIYYASSAVLTEKPKLVHGAFATDVEIIGNYNNYLYYYGTSVYQPHSIGIYAYCDILYMKMTKVLADGPIIQTTPEEIDFGDVPNGAWKHSKELSIKNVGLNGVLTDVDVTGFYFTVSGDEPPVSLISGAQISYQVSPGTSTPGPVNETLTMNFAGDREEITVPLSANAYTPVSPDVFELAQEVSSFPFSDSPALVHNVYQLPGDHQDGPDAVYKLSFTNDVLLNAQVTNGDNPKVALYRENFNGDGGPHFDNAYTGPVIATPQPMSSVSSWLSYVTETNPITAIGANGDPVWWAVMFPSEQLAELEGCYLTKVRVFDPFSGEISMRVSQGGSEAPSTLVAQKDFSFTGSNTWRTIELDNPVMLDVSQNLWICFRGISPGFPAAGEEYCDDPNGCWFSLDGVNWGAVTDYHPDNPCSWMIRAYVTNEQDGKSRALLTEGEISGLTVEAGTYYLVASSTDEGFQVNIDTEALPLPVKAFAPVPADGSSNLSPNLKLTWNFGEYTTEYRLLLGTTNPPQDVVVDWTDEFDAEYVTGLLSNRTQYYWRVDERNSSGVTLGDVWSFVTILNAPENLYAEKTMIHEGDTVVLQWEAPFERGLTSYHVYQDNVCIGNTTDNVFMLSGLTHNTAGYHFSVTAVYDEGESLKSEEAVVGVLGKGWAVGSVVEQDLTSPVAGATVNLVGWDDMNASHSYQVFTDENGSFEGELFAGAYTLMVLKEGYQSVQLESPITIQYQNETRIPKVVLNEVYASDLQVIAENADNGVRISWLHPAHASDSLWLSYDDGNYVNSVGSVNQIIYWGISFPDMSTYAGMNLSKIAYYDAEGYQGTITANIYLGGTMAPGLLMSSQEFTVTGTGDFIDIDLTVPVAIDGTQPLWITCYCDNMRYPASACGMTNDANGRWYSGDGVTWVDVSHTGAFMDYTWMLRGYLEGNRDESARQAESPRSFQYYNLYRSACYNEDDAVLIASNIADTIYYDEGWDALEMGVYKWGVSSIYQGNRGDGGAREVQTLLSEGFEGGVIPEGWSQYGGDWSWQFTNAFVENTGIGPHTGSYAAFCNSDGESGTRNLVTPPIDLTTATSATLDFWYVLPDWDGDWDDLYVKYSTSPDGPWTTLWTASSDTWTWTEKTIDLTELCGGVVYLDFAEGDWWGYGAAIDDVEVTADIASSGFDFQTLIDEGFEDSTIPTNWSQYGGDWSWQFTSAFAENIGIGPHSGSRAAFCNSDGESGTRNLVTPPIDLTTAVSATLDFWYVLPDWDGDWDDLYVKYGPSPTGPWTTLWTAPSDTWTWTEKTIDLSALCGGVVYLDFVEGDWWGYGAAIDDVKVTAVKPMTDQPHESAIVWSNCLGKDMAVTVEVTVTTDNSQSMEGTMVKFISVSEPGQGFDYEVILDESGQYVWNDFRKGTYLYVVKLDGYASCSNYDTVSIWEDTSLQCVLQEILHSVNDLYVSPTGWATWNDAIVNVDDEFYYDFEDGTLGDWTRIDANGDGLNWKLGFGKDPLHSPYGHNSSHFVYSESWRSDIGFMTPDNYLVSKRVRIGEHATFSFYVCAGDSNYNQDHYGVAVSTNSNTDPSDFVTIWEETLSDNMQKNDAVDPKGTRAQSNWYYKEIDLSAYAGQEVYIALRHFDCFDELTVDIDDIRLSNGFPSKNALSYKVMLDGNMLDEANVPYYQHDEDALVAGQSYTTTVTPVFATGEGAPASYTWTYAGCNAFEGAANLEVTTEEDQVQLHWTLPDMGLSQLTKSGQWYYYDNGTNVDAIGTTDGSPIYWGIKLDPQGYHGNKLTKVSMFDRAETGHEGRIMIYQGGDEYPVQQVYEQDYETFGSDKFVEFDLETPVVIDDSQSLWIVMNNYTGTYVASASANTYNVNGRWISFDGKTWYDVAGFDLVCTWMIRAYLAVENTDGIIGTLVWRDGERLTETPMEGTSYNDIGLEEGQHEYCIRVVHDGMSDSTYYAVSCELCEEIYVDPTSVAEEDSDELKIYPNPTRGELTIQANGMKRLRIVDMLGRKVYDQAVDGDETTLNLSGFGSGVYLVNIITEKGVINRRIVVHD